MRVIFLILIFFSLTGVKKVNAQTYWHYVMDTCSVYKSFSKVFVQGNDVYTTMCEVNLPSTLHLYQIQPDLLLEEVTSVAMNGGNYSLGGGMMSKVNSGYLYSEIGTTVDLIKFNNDLSLEWHIDLLDQINVNDPQACIPQYYCEDSNFIYGVGSNQYSNSFQCFNMELQLFKMDLNGNIIQVFNYPYLVMNSGIGCDYEAFVPSGIRIINNELEVFGTGLQNSNSINNSYENLNVICRFDLNGNFLSLQFMGENNGLGQVQIADNSYLSVRQELVNQNVNEDSQLKIFKKDNYQNISNLVFENPEIWNYQNERLVWSNVNNEYVTVGTINTYGSYLSYSLHQFNLASQALEWSKNYSVSIPLQNPEDIVNVSQTLSSFEVMPDGGYTLAGHIMYLNNIYPWIIRTDACGDEVYNGCTISGVSELVESTSLKLFPNPAVNEINIQLPNTDNWIVRVFNSNGQLVSTENINQSNFIQLNIQNMNTGLYTVQAMNSAGRVYAEMVVKE